MMVVLVANCIISGSSQYNRKIYYTRLPLDRCMNPADVDPMLLQTIADHKVSPGEKTAFLQWLTDVAVDEQALGFVRHRACALARAAIVDLEAKQLIEWLEDIIKLTLKPSFRARPRVGEAGVFQSRFRLRQCRDSPISGGSKTGRGLRLHHHR